MNPSNVFGVAYWSWENATPSGPSRSATWPTFQFFSSSLAKTWKKPSDAYNPCELFVLFVMAQVLPIYCWSLPTELPKLKTKGCQRAIEICHRERSMLVTLHRKNKPSKHIYTTNVPIFMFHHLVATSSYMRVCFSSLDIWTFPYFWHAMVFMIVFLWGVLTGCGGALEDFAACFGKCRRGIQINRCWPTCFQVLNRMHHFPLFHSDLLLFSQCWGPLAEGKPLQRCLCDDHDCWCTDGWNGSSCNESVAPRPQLTKPCPHDILLPICDWPGLLRMLGRCAAGLLPIDHSSQIQAVQWNWLTAYSLYWIRASKHDDLWGESCGSLQRLHPCRPSSQW